MTSEDHEIDLRFRGDGDVHQRQRTFTGRGFGIERAQMIGPLSFDYAWSGDAHYLALHDIMLRDGEVHTGGSDRSELLDLRDRLTFAPKGVEIEGWSSLATRRNSYLALTFSPDLLYEGEQRSPVTHFERPRLYFLDPSLRQTLEKLDRLLTDPSPPDPLMAETLGILAVLELNKAMNGSPADKKVSALPPRQLTTVLDYVEAHLADPITLDSLAGLTGLSRYHFARAFAASTGRSPVQFVRERRIERARMLLRTGTEDLTAIARMVGFAGPRQFANAFKRQLGQSPTAYRRAAED